MCHVDFRRELCLDAYDVFARLLSETTERRRDYASVCERGKLRDKVCVCVRVVCVVHACECVCACEVYTRFGSAGAST